MADLEDQLRNYADQVEDEIVPAPLPVRPSRTRAWGAAVAAVISGVVALGAVVALGSDDEPDAEIDVISDPDGDVVPETDDVGPPVTCPDPDPEPERKVEDEQVTVPELTELYYDTAEQSLRNQGLVPVVHFRTVPFGDRRVGLVIEQDPSGSSLVDQGSEVIIVVGEAGREASDE